MIVFKSKSLLDLIKMLVENPEVPCVVGNVVVRDGYGRN